MFRSPAFWVFITLLAALHFYIGWRIIPDLPVGELAKAGAMVFLIACCFLLPFGLLPIKMRNKRIAELMTWMGLLVMGFESSLLVLTVMRDIALLILGYIHTYLPLHSTVAVTSYSAALVPLIAALLTLIGFFNARRTAQVVEVDVPIKNLPDPLHGFTIAQISDIHVGPTIKHGYLDAIVDKVNRLNPHIVAVTGDLVDGSVKKLARHAQPLSRLKSAYGSYFVTGNHEYYSGAHGWINELRRLGVQVLLNEHVLVHHEGVSVLIAGVTDYTAHYFDPQHKSCPHTALNGAPEQVGTKLLLAHQPRSAMAAADAGFDLQLSGHTHGGQFLPWNFFVRLQQPFTAGLNRFKNLWVYTSRGTGYWGPPKRLGAPSEITRLRLIRA